MIKLYYVLIVLGWSALSAMQVRSQEITDSGGATVNELISQLADRKFVARQQAMGRLIALGGPAIPALKAAIIEGDRETRFRATRVLNAVEENVYQQQLDEFLRAGQGDEEVALPGWNRFCILIKESSESRRLFVRMSRAEPNVLRSVDRGASAMGHAIDRRCTDLQMDIRKGIRDGISVGTIAALLFVAGIEDVKLDRNSVKTVYSVCNTETFSTEMYTKISNNRVRYKVTARSEMLRELFSGCLQQCESWDAQMAFSLAMRYNIKQCVARAITLINDKQTPCHVAQTALVAVGKFGELKHIPILQQRIDDKSFCGVTQRIGDVQYQTQLRDVAICAMLTIAAEDPKKYGFPRISYSTTRQVNYATVGFADEAKRAEVRRKWDAFHATIDLPKADKEAID